MGNEARYGWMVAPDMKKSGEIKLIDATGQTLKEIKFEDAYCVGYTEEYEAFSGGKAGGGVSIKEGAKETLTLSCRVISVGGESHENSWLEG
jgi:UDP-N-acetylmuramyl pentapeptide synthase